MKISLNNGAFITDDSRLVRKDSYFLVSKSNAVFEDDALKKGAKLVDAKAAKNLLGINSQVKLVGITGTNGKTTTTFALAAILENLGFKVGVSGTCGVFVNGQKIADKALTTPEILETLSYLETAQKSGCDYFIMEVSSHAIVKNRIDSLEFFLRIFTNLSQDHLDFHKTFKEYASVKSSFFCDTGLKLINIDEEIKFNPKNAFTYSLKNENSDFFVSEFSLENAISASIYGLGELAHLNSLLRGKFNLYNALAAVAAAKLLTKATLESVVSSLQSFKGVAGRVEVVNLNPLTIIDFAHTPDGIDKVLDSLEGELVVVFGAGGDRDKSKRPLMGSIVQKYASVAIITSDNPRSEEPNLIIEDILEGIKPSENLEILIISDREKAIEQALKIVGNRTLVILGKGDEEHQEISGKKIPFSDKLIVQQILNKVKNENRDID